MFDLYSIRKVFATREGLQGKETASGYRIPIKGSRVECVPFVALPSEKALGAHILIHNPQTGFSTIAVVLDVGPHFTDDDAYVFGIPTLEPQWGLLPIGLPKAVDAHIQGHITNPAGIDLSEVVWNRLGMKDNGIVEWRFLTDSYLENLAFAQPNEATPQVVSLQTAIRRL